MKFVQSIPRRVGAVGALLAALAVSVPYPADAQFVDLPLPADLEVNLPSELSNSIIPVLDGLQLPLNVAQTLGAICPPPLSSECSDLLEAVAVLAPSAQQIVTTALPPLSSKPIRKSSTSLSPEAFFQQLSRRPFFEPLVRPS